MAFSDPVSEYMTPGVESVVLGTSLRAVADILERRRISSVPVVADGGIVGVVSRTDLVHAGVLERGRRGVRLARALAVPDVPVDEVMNRTPVIVSPSATLGEAARRMLDRRVHRVFVVAAQQLVGVLSTIDLAAAVRDARVARPLATIMSTPINTVSVDDRLDHATQQLDRSKVSGLIVVEDGWPVGVFTQLEALASRDLPEDTPIEDVFDQALICLPEDTRLHRAAAHAARLDVRRVVACRHREAVGVVGGLDFARVVAGR